MSNTPAMDDIAPASAIRSVHNATFTYTLLVLKKGKIEERGGGKLTLLVLTGSSLDFAHVWHHHKV